jgi:hypothetical protein
MIDIKCRKPQLCGKRIKAMPTAHHANTPTKRALTEKPVSGTVKPVRERTGRSQSQRAVRVDDLTAGEADALIAALETSLERT